MTGEDAERFSAWLRGETIPDAEQDRLRDVAAAIERRRARVEDAVRAIADDMHAAKSPFLARVEHDATAAEAYALVMSVLQRLEDVLLDQRGQA